MTLPLVRRFHCVFVVVVAFWASTSWSQSVTTYHYDNNRTGWNSNEPNLTPANVSSSYFGVLHSVTLDELVSGQPLYVPGVNITAGAFQGVHDVVYVATENNTVYAIDAESGTVLLSPNLGPPVIRPLGCNSPVVGIDSTPVIDPISNTLNAMVYTQQSSGPAYLLHSLDLGSLTDKVAPQLVTASQTLADGTTTNFNAKYQRQRPALLLANGNIYAGFGSFCDGPPSLSRGWLLGWQAGTLTPLPSNRVFNVQTTSPHNFFLASIWMSGFGPSADDSGNVLVVTGNSDPSGTTYDGITSIQHSVVKVSPDLSTVLDLFTPSNWPTLDVKDLDFGSGGVLVLPDQPGLTPHLAVAAGKPGTMFLMNEDSLGGYSSLNNNVLGSYNISPCWCGLSYFVDPTDSLPRVVSSGGKNVKVWTLQSSVVPSLTLASQSVSIGGEQDPGFFTSISSNGTRNPIIWAVSRPSSADLNVYLYAFDPDAKMATLLRTPAGTWPNLLANANVVPVVANGRVIIGSHNQLQIFGLTGTLTTTALTSSANPSVYGQSVTFTATVSSAGSQTVPTGTITFKDGATVLGTSTLAGGVASLTTSTLAGGKRSITAVYGGDSNFVVSASPVVTQTVNPASTTTTVAAVPSASQYFQPVVLTATVNSVTGAIPIGNVVFKDGTHTLGAGTLSSGTASLSVSTMAAGTHSITAVYSGPAVTFTGSTSAAVTVTVSRAPTTTTLTSTPNPSTSGQSVTFTATVLGANGGSPTAGVRFTEGTTVLGTVAVNATTHQATLVLSTLAVGTHNVTATFLGGGNFLGSTSGVVTQVVN